MVGDTEDLMDACLATAVQRREAAPEPEGSGRQQEILHAGVDGGARLEAGPARDGGGESATPRRGGVGSSVRTPVAVELFAYSEGAGHACMAD